MNMLPPSSRLEWREDTVTLHNEDARKGATETGCMAGQHRARRLPMGTMNKDVGANFALRIQVWSVAITLTLAVAFHGPLYE
jgi:hypothetical protein